jgi:hypothetical protein
MQPLMIAGRVGKLVDLVLGDRAPVADNDLLSDKIKKRIGMGVFRQDIAPIDRVGTV